MATRSPPLAKREGKHREEILELIEEGWQAKAWATNMPKTVHEILLRIPELLQNQNPLFSKDGKSCRQHPMDPHGRDRESPY